MPLWFVLIPSNLRFVLDVENWPHIGKVIPCNRFVLVCLFVLCNLTFSDWVTCRSWTGQQKEFDQKCASGSLCGHSAIVCVKIDVHLSLQHVNNHCMLWWNNMNRIVNIGLFSFWMLVRKYVSMFAVRTTEMGSKCVSQCVFVFARKGTCFSSSGWISSSIVQLQWRVLCVGFLN